MDNNEFKAQELLDKLLIAGQEFAEKGKAYAEKTLDIPETGEEREKMLEGLKKGAIASAILVGLLGTKGGRSLTGKAIKIGGLAALGTAAYKGYKNWRNKPGEEVTPVHELEGDAAHERSFLLISAMVSAANADGKLDDNESALLKQEILSMKLPKNLYGKLSAVIDSPLSAGELAQQVDDQGVASEVYLASRLFIDDDSSEQESAYLADLINQLGLNADLVSALDNELS